jgi:hypothetical protein
MMQGNTKLAGTQIQATALHEKKMSSMLVCMICCDIVLILRHCGLNLVLINLLVPQILNKNVQIAWHVPNWRGSSSQAIRMCCGQENESETYDGMCMMFWVLGICP